MRRTTKKQLAGIIGSVTAVQLNRFWIDFGVFAKMKPPN
jgi:hypothetical protein